ncbi:hypothetical protein OF117_10295 [Geodermatophilus sp. YIM 151500]|uniref:hypothetical protein n=1 Tax=Geodermatophilus sp. YIM 151500 TaxID=2984531 RepID=UPI0021E38F8E|nr:hypothetical protein [Geodermatophilus sp. YIM 151500]MCV2489751.1 hypothetical protein [Geodermatophilus sp. YIM 151500]
MTDRPQEDRGRRPAVGDVDAPTSDLSLPRVPPPPRDDGTRPPRPATSTATGPAVATGSAADGSTGAPATPPSPPQRRPSVDPVADQPTDRLAPRTGHGRKRTLTFAPVGPSGGHAATPDGTAPRRPGAPRPPGMPSVVPRRRRRRWPWVLLTLLPFVVIAGAGAVLAVLLLGG